MVFEWTLRVRHALVCLPPNIEQGDAADERLDLA